MSTTLDLLRDFSLIWPHGDFTTLVHGDFLVTETADSVKEARRRQCEDGRRAVDEFFFPLALSHNLLPHITILYELCRASPSY